MERKELRDCLICIPPSAPDIDMIAILYLKLIYGRYIWQLRLTKNKNQCDCDHARGNHMILHVENVIVTN